MSHYQVIYHPLAEKEYLDSIAWYEEILPGLSKEFVGEVERILDILERKPFLFLVKNFYFREAIIKTFPYLIIYKINQRKKLVAVLSVFHTSRNPSGKYKRRKL